MLLYIGKRIGYILIVADLQPTSDGCFYRKHSNINITSAFCMAAKRQSMTKTGTRCRNKDDLPNKYSPPKNSASKRKGNQRSQNTQLRAAFGGARRGPQLRGGPLGGGARSDLVDYPSLLVAIKNERFSGTYAAAIDASVPIVAEALLQEESRVLVKAISSAPEGDLFWTAAHGVTW